jgi:hypothetical protein
MCRPKFLTAALVAAVAALAGPSTSQAAFTITFQTTGATDITLTDQVFGPVGAGDQSATVNRIASGTFAFGQYEIEVTATSNAPGGTIPGVGEGGYLTQNTFAVRALVAGAASLTIIVSDDRYTIPGAGQASVTNSISSTFLSSGSVSATTTVSPTTGGSFTTAAATLTGPFSTQKGADTFGLTTITSTPFTITNTLIISGLLSGPNTGANITTTSTVTAPAPAGLILAATALPFAGLLRRRLRRPEATTVA